MYTFNSFYFDRKISGFHKQIEIPDTISPCEIADFKGKHP